MTVCLPPHPLLGLLLLAIPFGAFWGASVLLFVRFSVVLHFFRNLQRWEIASMAGMVIVLSALAYGLSPHGPVVYFDEFQHAEAMANTIEKLDPHGCCEYRNGECLQGGPMLWPLTSHVAALPFWFLASDDNPVRRAFKARTFANILWMGLSPALITLWLLLLFKRPSLAHAGGWLWVLNPIPAKLMFSASLMPSAVGLSLLALIALERWRNSEKVLDFLVVTFLLIATIHTRMEMALIAVWLPFRLRTSGTKRLSWLLFFLLVASALPLGFLYSNGAAGGAAGWNETLSQSWTHLLVHLPANLAFLAGSFHVPLLLPLAVIGIFCERKNSRTLGLLLTSLGFLLFYSAYHIGRFDLEQSFDGWRYSSMVTLFLLPLAAVGWDRVWQIPHFTSRKIATGTIVVAMIWILLGQQSFRAARHPLHALDEWMQQRFESEKDKETDPITLRFYTKETAYVRAFCKHDISEWNVDRYKREALKRPTIENRYLRSWNEAVPEDLPGLHFEPMGASSPDTGNAVEFRIIAH